MNPRELTGAVIVAYHPDQERLDALITALREQVGQIVVSNNGPADSLGLKRDSQLEVLNLDDNLGVGEAINRGVDRLIEEGRTRALLLDQDSCVGPDLVEILTENLDQEQSMGEPVAAIGPRIRDHGDRQAAPFIRFRLPFNQRLSGTQGCVDCDFIITSGSLLDLNHWATTGPMRAAWFIDNIDLDWCFRARRKGYRIVGCFDATLDHEIGERQRLFGFIPYRRHPPSRLHTMMRNRIYLYRSGAPRTFIAHDALRAIGKLALFSLIPPRRAHLMAMLRGLREGMSTRPLP